MGDSIPQLTRRLASDLLDLDQIERVIDHDGSSGMVAFAVGENSLSINRLNRLLPDGYRVNVVVTPDDYTAAYIEG